MNFRRFLRAGAFIMAVAMMSSSLAGPARGADPYDIPVILSLTGIYAFIGKGSQAGLQGVEQVVNATGGVNGRPINFVFQDDASSPQNSLQLANAIIAKGTPFIIGPSNTGTCSPVAAVVGNGPVVYCLTPGVHPPAGSWVFSANVSSDITIIVGLRYLQQRGLRRIAILASTDASGQDQERGVDEAVGLPGNKDFSIVAREHFAPNDVSVAAQLTRIKAANPQVLMLMSVGTAFGTGVHAVSDSGLDVPVFTTNGNSTYAAMKQYAAYLPKELLSPNQPPLAIDAITDKAVRDQAVLFNKTVSGLGVKPDGIPATTWDPGWLFIGAIKKYGFGVTAAQAKEYISTQRNYAGAMGRYDFRAVPQRGLGEQSVIITKWDAQKDWWVPVSKPGGAP